MSLFTGAAKQHKRLWDRYIDEAGVDVTLRFVASPSGAPTSDFEMVSGDVEEDEIDPSQDRVIRAVWTTDYTSMTDVDSREILDALGALALQNNDLDAVLRVKLTDALTKSSSHSPTYFELSDHIVHDGYTWDVTGTVRTGLPPVGPYALWVGVTKIGEA